MTITRTYAQHGSDELLARCGEVMGQVSGYVLATDGEPTVCVAGEAIWPTAIADALHTLRPDVTVLNAGEARWVRNAAPDAQIVAVHMEGLNHCWSPGRTCGASRSQEASPTVSSRRPPAKPSRSESEPKRRRYDVGVVAKAREKFCRNVIALE